MSTDRLSQLASNTKPMFKRGEDSVFDGKPTIEEDEEFIRHTIRLSKDISQAIKTFCAAEGISLDHWTEAAFTYLQDKSAMTEIVAIAQKRKKDRKARGERKKYRTMQSKFSRP
jgi:hypothetical protein